MEAYVATALVNTGGCGTKEFGDRARSSSESGEDSDEEDHADEGEGDQDEHQPQQPVHRLLGVLLQSLRLGLQLLKIQVSLAHGLAQGLGNVRINIQQSEPRVGSVKGIIPHRLVHRLVVNIFCLILPTCGQNQLIHVASGGKIVCGAET